MLKAVTVLFVCLAVGSIISHLTHLPLPGSVFGLLILLTVLLRRGGPATPLRQACNTLLQNMSVLFVPAGVGLITQLPALRRDALAIGVAIMTSTLLGIAVTAATMRLLGGEPE